MKAWFSAARGVGALAACLAITGLAGCAPTMTFGSLPRVENVPSLKVGASTTGEVRNALGEPRGRGRARFSVDLPEQDVWFYEYMQSDGQKVQLKMLLVFVDKDVYAGHMWFSSGQLVGVTK